MSELQGWKFVNLIDLSARPAFPTQTTNAVIRKIQPIRFLGCRRDDQRSNDDEREEGEELHGVGPGTSSDPDQGRIRG